MRGTAEAKIFGYTDNIIRGVYHRQNTIAHTNHTVRDEECLVWGVEAI